MTGLIRVTDTTTVNGLQSTFGAHYTGFWELTDNMAKLVNAPEIMIAEDEEALRDQLNRQLCAPPGTSYIAKTNRRAYNHRFNNSGIIYFAVTGFPSMLEDNLDTACNIAENIGSVFLMGGSTTYNDKIKIVEEHPGCLIETKRFERLVVYAPDRVSRLRKRRASVRQASKYTLAMVFYSLICEVAKVMWDHTDLGSLTYHYGTFTGAWTYRLDSCVTTLLRLDNLAQQMRISGKVRPIYKRWLPELEPMLKRLKSTVGSSRFNTFAAWYEPRMKAMFRRTVNMPVDKK